MANQYDTNLKLQAIADAIGDSQSSGLIQALEDIADAVAGGGGGGSSIAGLVSDNFSETDTYDLGDYCIHNNTLYVCINAITTPGAWDLSDWQATNAGMELSSLNSAKADKTDITPQLYTRVVYGVTYQLAIIGRIAILSAYSGNLNRALNAYDALITLGAFDSSLNGKKFSIGTQTLCTTNTGIRVGMDVNTQNTSTYSAVANGSALRFTLTGVID